MMAGLVRLLWIVAGYLAAAFAASLILTIFFAALHPLAWLMFACVAMIKVVIPLSTPLSAIFIIWAERTHKRHIGYYLGVGVITGLSAASLFALYLYLNAQIADKFWSDAKTVFPTYCALAAVGGLFAGFVYWGIAGRQGSGPQRL